MRVVEFYCETDAEYAKVFEPYIEEFYKYL